MAKNLSKTKYPGNGYYYVICDICGRKVRAKDTRRATDALHKGLIVCKADYDKDNPQTYLRSFKERPMPSYNRGEQDDKFHFISDPSEIDTGDLSDPTGRTPGAARQLTAVGASASHVDLHWFGPYDTGSRAISGYKIERESPVGGGFSTLVSDTAVVQTVYTDTSVAASTQYNYRVTPLNIEGAGSASNEAAITTNAS